MTADSFRVMLAHAAKIPSTATHSQLNVRAGRGLVGEGARPKDHLNADAAERRRLHDGFEKCEALGSRGPVELKGGVAREVQGERGPGLVVERSRSPSP